MATLILIKPEPGENCSLVNARNTDICTVAVIVVDMTNHIKSLTDLNHTYKKVMEWKIKKKNNRI